MSGEMALLLEETPASTPSGRHVVMGATLWLVASGLGPASSLPCAEADVLPSIATHRNTKLENHGGIAAALPGAGEKL